MTDGLFGITWAASGNMIWFVVLFLLIIIVILTAVHIKNFVGQLAHPRHQTAVLKHFSWHRYVIRSILISSVLLLLGVALLRPQWDRIEERAVSQGRDVIILLDISRSMLAQDYKPNRLEYAQQKIKKLLDMLQAERVGLIVFSGAAMMQCPLTTDYQAFMLFLNTLSVETISSGTTSYASALQKVIEAFSDFGPSSTKLVALFTDGEDFSGDLTEIQKKITESGIHIFTFGVATDDGAPIPIYDLAYQKNGKSLQQGFQKDENGAIVISRLNRTLIQQLAQATGGKSVAVTSDDQDLIALKRWVESFEKSDWEERNIYRLQDKYYYYTGLAWLLLLLEWIL
jgi:Ca-activated chloride channel homolog